jgi:hypothetical protein
MDQQSLKGQDSRLRRRVEKVKSLVRGKKVKSDPQREDLPIPATDTTLQPAAWAIVDQGSKTSLHATESVARETVVSLPRENASSPQSTETAHLGTIVAPMTPGSGSGEHTTRPAAQLTSEPPMSQEALNPQPRAAEALPSMTATTPLLYSKNAPIWNQTLPKFQEDYANEYAFLVAGIGKNDKACIQNWNGLFDPKVPQKLSDHKPGEQSHAIVQRVKRYLPSLSLVKGVTMTFAAMDPHKTAPYICAGVFFAIEA